MILKSNILTVSYLKVPILCGSDNMGKCAADVVTACDGANDGCGFCYDHCPYYNCLVHKKPHGLTSKCMKEKSDTCPIDEGAPDCSINDDETCVWRCEHYKEVHIDEDGKITIMNEERK